MGLRLKLFVMLRHKPTFSLIFLVMSSLIDIGSSKRKTTCDFVKEKNTNPNVLKLDCEHHKINTIDDYELDLVRIIGGKNSRKLPVLLAHGLFGSSDIFVLAGRKQSIAFNLLREGYDVWMLNHRGNRYSLGHKLRNQGKIDTFKYRWSGKYWQFSFWEMAVYDHPAIIDYILEETGAEQLHYAGYSMGTMTLLAGMDFYSYLNHQDSRAELTEDVREKLMPFKELDGYDMQGKIASAHLIGSVWNCAGFINPLKEKNSKFYNIFQRHTSWTEKKFVPNSLVNNPAVGSETMEKVLGKFDILAELANAHPEYYIRDKSALDELYQHVPQGTSIQTVMHFSKLIETHRLGPYNDVRMIVRNKDNKLKLKLFELDLSYIKNVPTYLYYGDIDTMAHENESKDIYNRLKDKNKVELLSVENADHLGMIAVDNAGEKYIHQMRKNMNKH